MAKDIISVGDTVKVSDDYPIREFAGLEGEVMGTFINNGSQIFIVATEAITRGEIVIFADQIELADIHRNYDPQEV
jgi:hypothetical protein